MAASLFVAFVIASPGFVAPFEPHILIKVTKLKDLSCKILLFFILIRLPPYFTGTWAGTHAYMFIKEASKTSQAKQEVS